MLYLASRPYYHQFVIFKKCHRIFYKIHEVRVTCPWWCRIELANEAFFPLSNRYYDHCKSIFYEIFIAGVVTETSCLIKTKQSISPNYNWENGVKQIRSPKKIGHKSCILCQLLRTKTLTLGSKCIKHFPLFLPPFALYLLSGCDLFNMSCIS